MTRTRFKRVSLLSTTREALAIFTTQLECVAYFTVQSKRYFLLISRLVRKCHPSFQWLAKS